MQSAPTPPIYQPTASERSRQDFVLGLKLLANGPMQARVREEYARRCAAGAARAATEGLVRSAAFREWAALTHASQSMMWAAVEPTAQRAALAADAEFARCAGAGPGSLELDGSLRAPEPVAGTEIHRQPGGYLAGGAADGGTIAGLRYLGSSLIYSAGKGVADPASDARGAVIVEQVRRRFPALAPRRILDLGCGIGLASQAVARAWPQAEYHALDVAPGLLRLARLLAQRRGVAIHFHQRDAASSAFPDRHFDLIVSNILFHETSATQLPAILRECRRLLTAPGAMLHVDVPTQVARLGPADQLMNDWQVRWNGEPFWGAFARLDLREAIVAAGFPPAAAFAEQVVRSGGGSACVFGASL